MEKSGCLKCASPLPSRRGRGRPRSYCSAACRRAAEFEIRRASMRLQALENRASDLRILLGFERPAFGKPFDADRAKRQLAAVESEIARGEARLRALLAGASDGGPEAA